MIKFKYSTFFFLVFFIVGHFSASAKPLEAVFIGNEAFRITDGDYILLTDFPYESGAYGYMKYKYNYSDNSGNVLALITHRHADHFDPKLLYGENWKVTGPLEVTAMVEQKKVLKLEGETKFGPIKIVPKKTKHANVEHFSYLVIWHDRKFFFTGDTDELEALKNLPELDALFISPWFYRKAKIADALPESKNIVIYHHRKKDIIPDCSGCIIPAQNQIINFK
ncbi:MAG: MBL fold metallo-hydrolase [Desulfobulbaceae bacterium]|nr:MBL fold metallo-hydrolase [Desulfobulbaceae bacterium]